MKLFRHARQFALITSVCLLIVGGSFAQNDSPFQQASSPALRTVLSQWSAKYNIPGLAVAVIDRGQVQAIEAFGVRDKQSNAPITQRTIFEAGALGEPIFAYAVLRLAAEGHFNITAPLPSFLPLPYLRPFEATSANDSTEPVIDPKLNQITAVRVMNHTSGMPDWATNRHIHLESNPGQKWSYSNEGYVYLQRAVEHATGESFDALVARSVLEPLRMDQSAFEWRESFAPAAATGYDSSGVLVTPHHYARPAPAATLYTTVQDYARFVVMLLASAPAQRAHESAVSQMLNPTVVVDSASHLSWGLGVGLEKSGSDVFFLHRENGAGFQGFFIANRDTRDGLVVFTSGGNGLSAIPEIVAATIGGNHPALKSSFLHAQ